MFVRASKYRRLRECAARVEGRCDALLVELGDARAEASRQAGRNAALQAEVATLKAELSSANATIADGDRLVAKIRPILVELARGA